MTVSNMYPTAALPSAVPTAATSLAGSTPLADYGATLPTNAGMMSALSGAQSTAGAASPEATAMAAAINQMRAQGVPDSQINQQLLAMQAPSGANTAPSATAAIAAPTAATAAHKATVAKKATVKKRPAGAKPKSKVKVKAKSKADTLTPTAATTTPVAAAVQPGASTLPANATQLPGGTVYSYADPHNAGLAGLQGLSPQQQLALGVMPSSMASGLTGATEPQANVTNQAAVDPSSLLGITGLTGLVGLGGVPTAGAPIVTNSRLSRPATTTSNGAPAAPTTATSPQGSQSVTNRNANDNGSFSQGVDPYSAMYGGYGVGGYAGAMPYGGYNTGIAGGLYSPYGASMTGATLTGTPVTNSGGIMGWLGRLFT